MSGGRFLVGLREVLNSGKIVVLKSLLKENICFWEDVGDDNPNDNIDNMEVIEENVGSMENEIQVAVLSKKVRWLYIYLDI